MKKKAGDSFVSKFGTNLRLTITAVTKTTVSFKAERKIVDRKTGEVLTEDRERTVTSEEWKFVAAGYVPARKA